MVYNTYDEFKCSEEKAHIKLFMSNHLQADNMPSAPLVLIMFPVESEPVEDCSNKIGQIQDMA